MAMFRNLDNNNDQFGQNRELSLQESQFAEMIKEMSCYDFPQNTLSMFLQYCPESVTHLFDKCIMPLGVQVNLIFFFPFIFSSIYNAYNIQKVVHCICILKVQGQAILDLFLFDPGCKVKCASELQVIEELLASRKERLLIHPLIQMFLRLKWQRTWFLYILYIFVFKIFFILLIGYSITHYGRLYEDDPWPASKVTRDVWW